MSGTHRYPADVFRPYRVCDADGNGADELCYMHRSELMAREGDSVRWSRPLPTSDCRLIGGPPASRFLVVYSPVGGTVLAVDPRTGDIVARGRGLMSDAQAQAFSRTLVLESNSANALPRVLSWVEPQYSGPARVTALSSMLATHPDGRYRVRGPERPARLAMTTDPRIVEYLPWVPIDRGIALPMELATFRPFVTAALMGTFIYVVPLWWSWGIVSHRTWSLRRWFLFPVIVGVALGAVQSYAANPMVMRESSGSPMIMALGFAAVGATMTLFPIELGVLLARRRFPAAIALVALSIAAAGVWGVWWMQLASAAFASEQSFRYDGWYLIWFSGAYVAGYAGVVVALTRWIARRMDRRSAPPCEPLSSSPALRDGEVA